MVDTILSITGVGIPPYSSRGLSQTLRPIGASKNMRRTVNGELLDIADPLFRKYESTIQCSDQDPPAVGGTWPGREVVVDCIASLAVQGTYTAAALATTFGKPVVAGSVRTADGFTFYRPQLTMLVSEFSIDTDEWGAATGWQMTLEEV